MYMVVRIEVSAINGFSELLNALLKNFLKVVSHKLLPVIFKLRVVNVKKVSTALHFSGSLFIIIRNKTVLSL